MEKWFSIDQIDQNTYVISEYRHWEETHCYLIEGENKALLIDTGLGVSDISPIVKTLTSKPVLAVATHVHWDHIGSHGSFDSIGVHELEQSWLKSFPLPLSAVRRDLVKDYHDFPEGFDPDSFTVFEGPADIILHDGDKIDLGGRIVNVLHTPGHSPGHMCFYEPSRGYLFSGDLLYKGTLFAFYPSTDPLLFASSIEKISALPVTRLFPGHHELDVSPGLIMQAKSAFDSLKEEKKLYQGSGVYDFGDIKIYI
ncbi:MAG: MBL fold metallo-hydrolase [Clostridiaceae bacterium]|nr:MBL fold metallo-hydrolase [Clostridiaceae bacterium]